MRIKYEAKERNEKDKSPQKQKIDTYSGYDLCQNCYHKREIHLGVCMLEMTNNSPVIV
jgi:hypothetical protein